MGMNITSIANFLVPLAALHAAIAQFTGFGLGMFATWLPMVVYGVAGVKVLGTWFKFWK